MSRSQIGEMNKKSIQIKYGFLQALYWGVFGLTIAFINSYLSGLGLGVKYIGTISASFTLLAALLQAYLGKLSDLSGKYNWRNILFILVMFRICANVLLMLVEEANLSGIIFGFQVMLMHTMMPFINAANFYYEEKGIELNYGAARGMGSLFYAVLTYFLGLWVAKYGIGVILSVGLGLSIVLLICVYMMPFDKEGNSLVYPKESGSSNTNFINKYPKYIVMLVGFLLLMTFHNNAFTYMLQILEKVGGSNKELGTAFALAAIFEIPIMFGYSAIRKKYSSGKLLIISSIAFVIKGVLYLFAASITGIYIAQVTQLLSFAVFTPSSVYYTQEIMDGADKVKGQSIMSSFLTLGSVFGSLIGGFLIDQRGINFNLTFILVLTVIATILIIYSREDNL